MKRPSFSLKYALIITGIVFMAYLVMAFNNRMTELRGLSMQHEQVASQLADLDEQKIRLETKIAYANSEEAVYQWAYEEGHMYREGDYPIVPLPPVESTPAPHPTPVVTQTSIENWQMWMWLFSDSGAPGKARTP